MRILINGNLGYIGPVVAKHLRQVWTDAEIIGFDSAYFAGCLVDSRIFPERVLDKQIFGDVRNIATQSLYNGVDTVVQLAAISNDPMGKEYEKVTHEINTEAVVQAARDAKACGVKNFVFASSCSVYGAGGDGAKTEDSELNPLTAYAQSKIAAEEKLKEIASEDFKITCLRFATACGFSPRIRLDLVLNDFVASAIAAKTITILSDGSPWRPLIHVNDMARAIEWACERPYSTGGSFLVVNTGANSWNFQVKELAEGVKNILGDIEISINMNAAPDKRSYRVCFDKYASLAPNHQPKETLESAVRNLVSGLDSIGFNDINFRNSNLIRLKVLSDHSKDGRLNKDLYWI